MKGYQNREKRHQTRPSPTSCKKMQETCKTQFCRALPPRFPPRFQPDHPKCTRFDSNELVHNTLPHHTSCNPREFHRSQTHPRELRPNLGSTGKVPRPLGPWAQAQGPWHFACTPWVGSALSGMGLTSMEFSGIPACVMGKCIVHKFQGLHRLHRSQSFCQRYQKY